jgi:hypothetical protein
VTLTDGHSWPWIALKLLALWILSFALLAVVRLHAGWRRDVHWLGLAVGMDPEVGSPAGELDPREVS